MTPCFGQELDVWYVSLLQPVEWLVEIWEKTIKIWLITTQGDLSERFIWESLSKRLIKQGWQGQHKGNGGTVDHWNSSCVSFSTSTHWCGRACHYSRRNHLCTCMTSFLHGEGSSSWFHEPGVYRVCTHVNFGCVKGIPHSSQVSFSFHFSLIVLHWPCVHKG